MPKRSELMPGTLDMLILKTLTRAPPAWIWNCTLDQAPVSGCADGRRGFTFIPRCRGSCLQGWVKAEWKKTETNRRARYYTLTAAGRKQLGLELTQFEQMIAGNRPRVLQDA